jgi:hypothetical protein
MKSKSRIGLCYERKKRCNCTCDLGNRSVLAVREQLKKDGVRFGVDFVMKSKSKPYINAEIFLDYVQIVLLLNRAELRTLDEFPKEIGVSCR